MRLVAVVLLVFLCAQVHAQCLTDLKTMLPDMNTPKKSTRLEIAGPYLFVNSSEDDTLETQVSGAMFVYTKKPTGWNFSCMLTPSIPRRYGNFGQKFDVDETGNIVVVGQYSPWGTSTTVCIFNKPASGWQSMTESETITLQDNAFLYDIAISNDGLTLAVGQQYLNNNQGIVTVYKRQSLSHSFSQSIPLKIMPVPGAVNFGADIALDNENLVVGAPTHPEPSGVARIYVYALSNVRLIATLSNSGIATGFGSNIQIEDGLIVATAMITPFPNAVQARAFVFKKPENGSWVDATETAAVSLHDDNIRVSAFAFRIMDADNFVATFRYITGPVVVGADASSRTIWLRTKFSADWTEHEKKTLLEEELPPGGYGAQNTVDITTDEENIVATSFNNDDGSPFVDAIVSMHKDAGEYMVESRFLLPGPNSANHHFGYDIARTEDALFVSAPFDSESFIQAGAVYIYEKGQNKEWIRTTKLTPTFTSLFATTYFGYSIAAQGNLLAVGSSRHFDPYGKVHIYERQGSTWENPLIIQTIQSPDSVSNFGEHVAINSELLVVPFFDWSAANGHQMGIYIYERTANGFIFSETITFAASYSRLKRLGVRVVLKDDLIYVFGGNYGQTDEVSSALQIYKKANGRWAPSSSFQLPEGISGWDLSFDVNENHVFIGSPLSNVEGKKHAGAVVVYTKMPETSWPAGDIIHSALITSQAPKEHAFFGFDIQAVENSLVIGAPENYDYFDGQTSGIEHSNGEFTREKPGSVYIFQSHDYFWRDVQQLAKLQGTYYNRAKADAFGFSIVADRDHYFIGAPFEVNGNGFWAGGLYTTPAIPVVKLIPPVCESANVVSLQGYPHEGTWSGNGILGSTFNPKLAGPGIHTLSYNTPNCTYQGKLRITVLASPDTTWTSPNPVVMCEEQLTDTLMLSQTEGARYSWFYKKAGKNNFLHLGVSDTASLLVSEPGSYYSKIEVAGCSATTAFVNVAREDISIVTGPQQTVCHEGQTIDLVASPSGGKWSGTGTRDKTLFDSKDLENGLHTVWYQYESPDGCLYEAKDWVRIETIHLAINPPQQKIFSCEGVPVTLSVTGAPALLTYGWYAISDQSVEQISEDTVVTILNTGHFKVRGRNDWCEAESETIEVILLPEDSIWAPNVFTPNGDDRNETFNILTEHDHTLRIFDRNGKEVFRGNELWTGAGNPSGIYYWVVDYQTCTGQAGQKKGWVHKLD